MKKHILVLNVLAVVAAVGITVEAVRPRQASAPPEPAEPVAVLAQTMTAGTASREQLAPVRAKRPPPDTGDVVLLSASHTSEKPPARLRAEWVEPRATLGEFLRQGQLRIYLDGQPTPLQTLEAEAARDPADMSLEFTDLNGDGHVDLVFDNAMAGTAGAAYGADVFLWIPKLQRFVKSETLSQAGEFSPGRAPNCVKVATKCSSTAWAEEELCFSQATGRWRTVADSGCRGAEADD